MEITKLKEVGFAVVGCGRMGQRRIKTIAEHPQAKLACVVDVSEERGQAIARSYSTSYYRELEKALCRDDVHAVVVSVPNKWHVEAVCAALAAGKHVFCEKPLAHSLEAGQRMVALSEKNNVTLKVGSNLRFFPNVIKAKNLIDKGAIGELTFLRSWIGHDGWNLKNPWYRDENITGGGTMLDNGCHIFDLIRWFMGDFKSCLGITTNLYWDLKSLEDNGFGIFETEKGQVATLHASWTDWAGYMYMEIYGVEGYIRIDNRSHNCLTVYGKRNGEEDTFDFSTLPPQSYKLEMEYYIDCLLQGFIPKPTGADGLRAIEAAFALYESARKGTKIIF